MGYLLISGFRGGRRETHLEKEKISLLAANPYGSKRVRVRAAAARKYTATYFGGLHYARNERETRGMRELPRPDGRMRDVRASSNAAAAAVATARKSKRYVTARVVVTIIKKSRK